MKARIIKTGEMVDVYHEAQHGQITNIYKESVLVNGRMWTEDELDFCVKANKASEKIYVHKSQYWGLMANERNITKDGIEYVRKDAFIEKACSWFADRYQANGSYLCADDIEDFEKYLKK